MDWGVARGPLQERPLQFQHGNIRVGNPLGELLTATRKKKDRYRILQNNSPLLGWRNRHFTAQISGFPEILSNPRVENPKIFPLENAICCIS